MKTIVKKRQYGSIKYYEFESFDEMMKDDVLSDLAQGDGYYGILDIYTDDKSIIAEKAVYENWYTNEDGKKVDKVYYIPSLEVREKYNMYDGGVECYPLSELPEDRKEYPVDNTLLAFIKDKPWNLE